MVNIKYDVTDVEDFTPYAGPTPPRGIYEGKIVSPEWKKSSGGNMMFVFTAILEPKKADQKKFKGAPIFCNLVVGDLSEEYQRRNVRQLVKSLGLPEKGSLNPEAAVKKMDGKMVRIVVKTENSEEYGVQAKFNGLLPLKGEEAPEGDDEADAEEPEGDEEEAEADEEEAEESSVEEDVAELTRAQLKKYIKDNELDVKITTKMSDDDIRTAIVEAWPDEEEAEEEAEDEDDGLDELDRSGLKKHIKDNSLEIKVTTKMTDDDIREAIRAAASDEDEGEDSEDEPPF